ncbi:MAG: hypothetical protein ACD_12C00650G0001 [uncultured bacterium]|nr:MAG: hypothetical protein ACD_12C00650G0001 [uncultured bacterium]
MDKQSNQSNSQPVKSSKNVLIVIVILLIIAVLIWVGIYFWQKNTNQNENQNLNNSNQAVVQKEWKTYRNQEHGLLFMYPNEWKTTSGDIECASVNEFDSLKLIVFSTCWQAEVGGPMLSFQETFSRFRNAFLEKGESNSKTINDINVETIIYSEPGDNGIYSLTSQEGTIALWQGKNYNYALLDENNQHQTDGYFDDVLASLNLDDDTVTDVNNVTESEIKSIDDTWNLYTNYQLGFSIKFPKRLSDMFASCEWKTDSYRPQFGMLPTAIFEDNPNGVVYFTSEYFSELTGETVRGGIHYFSGCGKVTNSLAVMNSNQRWSISNWKIEILDVANDVEVEQFIKTRYGASCTVKTKNPASQSGVYDVTIQQTPPDEGCFIGGMITIKYYADKHVMAHWVRGQSYSFMDLNNNEYDDEMENSFLFL